MGVFWSLLARTTTWWAGALVAVVEVGLALSARTPGLNLWADLVTGLSTAGLFSGVVAAGFAAFEAGRWAPVASQHGRATARSAALTRLLHAGVAAIPVLAGYLLALAVLTLCAIVTGTYGSPSVSWLVAIAATLVGATGFGWLVGMVGRGRWWVAPIAAVGFYAGYVIVSILPLPRGLQVLYPAVLAGDYVFVQPVLPTMLGITLFSLATAVIAVLVAGVSRRRSGRIAVLIGAVAGVVALAGVGASLSTGGQYTDTYNPDDFTCQHGGITVCLNPGYAAALPALHRQFAKVNRIAAGTPLAATRLEQNIEGDPPPANGSRAIHLEQLAGPSDLTFAVYRYLTEYGISTSCRDTGAYTTGPRAIVDLWLSGSTETRPQNARETRQYQALRAFSTQEGNTWLRRHYRQYAACTLTSRDLP